MREDTQNQDKHLSSEGPKSTYTIPILNDVLQIDLMHRNRGVIIDNPQPRLNMP
jgi:hypothetical protein